MPGAAAGESCRVSRRNHNPRDARLENRLGAWRSLSEVVARLERYVHGRSAGAIAGGLERNHFGVRLSRTCVVSFPDNDTVANDNSADHWVRRCLTPALLGEGQRATHVFRVARLARTRIELRLIRRFWNLLLACH